MKWHSKREKTCFTVKWCNYLSFWNCISNIKRFREVGFFRYNHWIPVLASVLMLYFTFSNSTWMLLIQLVFSGAHACTQSFNLQEEIRLFLFSRFQLPSIQVKGLPLYGFLGFWGSYHPGFYPAICLLASAISGRSLVAMELVEWKRKRKDE